MKVRLPEKLLEKIIEAGRRVFPEEACGLIGGTDKNGVREIKEIFVLENIDHSNEHFSMNPKDQLNAVKEMRKKGIIPLGNFHSHPESPSRPSEEDKRLAYDKNASYMILSLMEKDNPVINSFHIENNNSEKEELEIF
ncbi:MAG: M67 family metallopeptidase [Firmicutes bacterium]|nr:M67 family metallopeptidase [Bacillota bacterium]